MTLELLLKGRVRVGSLFGIYNHEQIYFEIRERRVCSQNIGKEPNYK